MTFFVKKQKTKSFFDHTHSVTFSTRRTCATHKLYQRTLCITMNNSQLNWHFFSTFKVHKNVNLSKWLREMNKNWKIENRTGPPGHMVAYGRRWCRTANRWQIKRCRRDGMRNEFPKTFWWTISTCGTVLSFICRSRAPVHTRSIATSQLLT